MLQPASRWLVSFFCSGLLGCGLYAAARWQANAAYSAPASIPSAETFRARGVVEPERPNTSIGSAVAGIVAEVFVTAEQLGQPLAAGTPLFRLDDGNLRRRLQVEETQLTTAEKHLAKLEAPPRPEDLAPLEARIRTTEANLRLLDDGFQRAQRLHARKALSEEEYSQRRLAREIGVEQLAQARAELAQLQAGASAHDQELARAQVEQLHAQLEQSRAELEKLLVRSPVEGTLAQLNVRVGEYVGAPPNQPLVVLSHGDKLRVRVEIDERDLPRFDPHRPVRALFAGQPQPSLQLRFLRTELELAGKRLTAEDSTDGWALEAVYALDAARVRAYSGQRLDVLLTSAPVASSLPGE